MDSKEKEVEAEWDEVPTAVDDNPLPPLSESGKWKALFAAKRKEMEE